MAKNKKTKKTVIAPKPGIPAKKTVKKGGKKK